MIAMVQIYGRNLARQFKSLPVVGAISGARARMRLDDGTPITVRPARPQDGAAVLAMHGRLSRSSLFFRYLGAYRPTRADIDAICRLDGREGLALVAVTGGRHPVVAGLAYMILEKERSGAAEPAIVIEEGFHGRGLGRRLFAHLCRLARKQKVAVLHTYIHKENRKMLGILKHLQYPLRQSCHANLVEAEILLDSGWLSPDLAVFGGPDPAECY